MPKGLRKLDYPTEVYSNGPVFDVPVIEEPECDFDEMTHAVRNSRKIIESFQ